MPVIVCKEHETWSETEWSEAQIENGLVNANKYWESTGLQFDISSFEYISDDKIYDPDGLFDFWRIMSKSQKLAKETHAYPVFFVDSIVYMGKTVGGISTTPSMPLGFQYGTSISSIMKTDHSCGHALAHELGHAWNLWHVWSDSHNDTPSDGVDDCNPEIKCNLMSYCPNRGCSPPFFSPEQIAEVRKWAFSPSRIHLLEGDQQASQEVFPLQDELTLIIDPIR
jgi:hypothetical protein